MLQSANPGVMEAVKEVRRMNLSRILRALYEERLKDQRDRWAFEDTARDEGRAEGRTEGETVGDLKRSRQAILDLLEELGTVPEDISSRIYAQEDTEVLRRWHKAAAKATSFADFRERIIPD